VRLRPTLAAALLPLAAACADDPTLPSVPRPDRIVILGQPDTVRIGTSVPLETEVLAGVVTIRTATVRWRSTDAVRAPVSDAGVVRGVDSTDALVIASVDVGTPPTAWPADTVAVRVRPVRP
jgi:hypothetical protein